MEPFWYRERAKNEQHMKKHTWVLLILGFLSPWSGIFGSNTNFLPGESVETHPNQYFVKLCHGVSNQEAKALMAELNSVELWKNDKIGLRLWSVKNFPYSCADGEISDINGHLVRSKKKTSIDDATLNMIFELEDTDFEPATTYFEDLNLRGELGSHPVRIAILDSGISDEAVSKHPNFTGLMEYTGYDYIDNDETPDDENGHGTQVAGIIYGIVNSLGIPNNITLDIRKTHDVHGLGNISDLIAATVDAVAAGADIINMSFSYYETLAQEELNPLKLAIDYAEQNGVLVIASAGNNFRDNDHSERVPVPATFPNENIISVASNRQDESRSFFSNYGANSVDVSILGEHIPGPGLHGEQFHASGTSFSTAIVSGLSAIIGSRQSSFNACEIKCTLINTSKEVSGWKGLNQAGGVINFRKALTEPPIICSSICSDQTPVAEVDCGANCPPETNDMDLCVAAGITIADKLLVSDPEKDAVTFAPETVYGPFNGSVMINPDGSFVYTSFNGNRDLFVYQVCDNVQTACSDGCNQGVVYINSQNCTSPSDNGTPVQPPGENCVKTTGERPKLLVFRYTGQGCDASNHTQDAGKVSCSGDPEFAPVVSVTAFDDKNEYYLLNRKVTLGKKFYVDAGALGQDKLNNTLTIQLKGIDRRLLQTVVIQTGGSQPLRIDDQFAGLVLDGYLSKDNEICGQVDLENRTIYDCQKDTGGKPRLLTFRYTGQACNGSLHAQDSKKVTCNGDPDFAPSVYVTAVGDKDKYYTVNQRVDMGGTFSIDAASAGESKLKSTTTFYLKDDHGNLLQRIEINTSGSQPLGLEHKFGSLVLEGYLSEKGEICGSPEIPDIPGDCCNTTGKTAQVLTFQYTGHDHTFSIYNQDPEQVNVSGDPEFAPFIYLTAESGDKMKEVFFRDLQVPLNSQFDIDAASIGKKKFESDLMLYLKDENGNILQEIKFRTDCSEPLVIGNRFGALQLKGYLAENGETRGVEPVSKVCDPTSSCLAMGKRSSVALVYVGSTLTTVDAFANTDSRDYIGSYPEVGPGDFIVFSSFYQNKDELKHLFLRWGGGSEIEIPVETSVDILGNTYGDFKVVQQLDKEGNDCRIPYSSCYELNRYCGETPAAALELIPPALGTASLDDFAEPDLVQKNIRLFPNPARNMAYLDFSAFSGQVVDLIIYDPVGRAVWQRRATPTDGTPIEIDVSTLSNGIYNVVVNSEDGARFMRKLVIAGHN